MAGIWDTYVLQATICMRPERACLEGAELLCSLRGHGNPRRHRVACIRVLNDLKKVSGLLEQSVPRQGSSSWNNQTPGATMSRGNYYYRNCEEPRGPARSRLAAKYNTPQSTKGHHSKPQHRSAPQRATANRSAPQRTAAQRSAPQRTAAQRTAPHRTAAHRGAHSARRRMQCTAAPRSAAGPQSIGAQRIPAAPKRRSARAHVDSWPGLPTHSKVPWMLRVSPRCWMEDFRAFLLNRLKAQDAKPDLALHP